MKSNYKSHSLFSYQVLLRVLLDAIKIKLLHLVGREWLSHLSSATQVLLRLEENELLDGEFIVNSIEEIAIKEF